MKISSGVKKNSNHFFLFLFLFFSSGYVSKNVSVENQDSQSGVTEVTLSMLVAVTKL